MTLKPLDDKIVIKKVEKEETTASGIVLPNSAKEESNLAEVVAIGKKVTSDEETKDELKVGDKVIFSKYAGTEVELEKVKYTILKYTDILAVIE
ncbi:co-chaperone GroES [Peptoniphilus indolicus]|uniref:Co-chaperonin GroES n=2 Tax=Peptoniphilus indolicus TaxID=33030 RepID=G4D2H2_9FIRM|nr:co-chaperone GroES [Peptoniphilus indolicus]EGY80274.1 chaperone GroES [Peptoniphilus indolicus ATCC 29427]SUB75315.1 co-chaperonin GroES [Peptoniphilus indolicus]